MRLIRLWPLAPGIAVLMLVVVLLPVSGSTNGLLRPNGDLPTAHRSAWPAWAHQVSSMNRSSETPKVPAGAMVAGSSSKQGQSGPAVHEFNTLFTVPPLQRGASRSLPDRHITIASVGVRTPPPRSV